MGDDKKFNRMRLVGEFQESWRIGCNIGFLAACDLHLTRGSRISGLFGQPLDTIMRYRTPSMYANWTPLNDSLLTMGCAKIFALPIEVITPVFFKIM
jgi:hypothetical protein